MQVLAWLIPVRGNLIATGALLLVLLIGRAIALRAIRRNARDDQTRLRWAATARNAVLATLLFGLLAIWATELQTFALSLAAVAAALLVALKEPVLCISGAMVRTVSGSFSVGDRVEMGGVRGDVIDSSLLTTTLLEVGVGHQRTGRALVVPNSVVFSEPIVNETFMDEYVLHVITVPIESTADWRTAEKALLTAGRAACAEHLEKARKFMDAQSAKHHLPAFSVEPRVLLAVPSPGLVNLVLRLPVPAHDRGRLEQRVLRDYLDHLTPKDDAKEI